MLMIVLEIDYNFFIVLLIRLKTCRSNDFFLLYKAKCARPKIGRLSEVLRTRERPTGIGRVIGSGLYYKQFAMICYNICDNPLNKMVFKINKPVV